MKIVFQITCLGIFGSVRELLENANRLVEYGHDVVIYSDLQSYPFSNWLPCKANLKQLGKIEDCDVLILFDSPFDYHYEYFKQCKAKFKTIVVLGLPSNFDLRLGNELYNYHGIDTELNLLEIFKEHEICADSNYQLEQLKLNRVKTGVSFGGVNLSQFKDNNIKRDIQIGWTGDKRGRKGTDILNKVVKSLPYSNDTYFKKGDQDYLVSFLNRCELFIDNHLQAGWVNPVLEAMACGCVCICRKIPALWEFANYDTAIVLKGPEENDFINAIHSIIKDEKRKAEIKKAAKKHIQKFSYDIVTKNIEKYLLSKI